MQSVEGVKGLIMKNDRYLALIEPDGQWDLPGGRVESAETYRECLLREVLEETGINVKILGLLTCWSFLKTSDFLVTGVTYYCQYLTGAVTLSAEHPSYCWADQLETYRFAHPEFFGASIHPLQHIHERRYVYAPAQ